MNCFSATSVNAVGITQLLEPSIQGQPNLRVAHAGTKIDDEIGAADGVFIMFDDENGVAEIAQLFERVEKAIIVARVQTDGGLV